MTKKKVEKETTETEQKVQEILSESRRISKVYEELDAVLEPVLAKITEMIEQGVLTNDMLQFEYDKYDNEIYPKVKIMYANGNNEEIKLARLVDINIIIKDAGE